MTFFERNYIVKRVIKDPERKTCDLELASLQITISQDLGTQNLRILGTQDQGPLHPGIKYPRTLGIT